MKINWNKMPDSLLLIGRKKLKDVIKKDTLYYLCKKGHKYYKGPYGFDFKQLQEYFKESV
jgi:hypothetical protein